ncbi:IclR family transcriptional regulator [Microvirga calopogonii]|jgi:DNA-binding IclR family transcriptional regulator|uniref:IclR family transcriptional regulator n=1 Tax=Microvirga calopogonii TaxID=2078013 RepID=UPI000E0CC1D9|nr:IclR family transcriptional regulator [Microvirga calopogonii]
MAKKASARPQAESVATADRVLAVLTAFRRGDRALSLAELAERTDLVKSTILRLLVSLESYGLIIRLHDGNYQLGAEVLRLGSIFQQSLELETHVMPVLQDLVDETEESASFYVRHGNQRLCAYRVDSPHRLRLHIQPGDILPMDLSAIARVLKAFAKWPDDTTAAQIDLPIYSSGATDPHTAAIAMPVFGANLRLVGALALSGPVTRLTPDRAQEIRVYLYAAAMRLTKSLGGTFETPQTRRMAGE